MTDSFSESENPAIPAPTPQVQRPRSNRDWWPNQLSLQVLHQNGARLDPRPPDHDYARTFADLDLDGLKRDIETVMTTSQP